MNASDIKSRVKQAAKVAERFRQGTIPPIVAEVDILGLGFHSIRHGPSGLEAQHDLTWYPLTLEKENG